MIAAGSTGHGGFCKFWRARSPRSLRPKTRVERASAPLLHLNAARTDAVLQYHFHGKTLLAIASRTRRNFCLRMFPAASAAHKIIEFVANLSRHVAGKLMIIWEGLPD